MCGDLHSRGLLLRQIYGVGVARYAGGMLLGVPSLLGLPALQHCNRLGWRSVPASRTKEAVPSFHIGSSYHATQSRLIGPESARTLDCCFVWNYLEHFVDSDQDTDFFLLAAGLGWKNNGGLRRCARCYRNPAIRTVKEVYCLAMQLMPSQMGQSQNPPAYYVKVGNCLELPAADSLQPSSSKTITLGAPKPAAKRIL
ncbi:hypothetical protein OUZ56_026146 [Daphnia magna]|uniref:Uncharacterized protein n=1 Tax=Daphnia magna TaxID=35525 RepID=A0ABQ9ZL38_9CRUS|nr:hypothetical protein OUZ56_026146 [Daphnia magna]